MEEQQSYENNLNANVSAKTSCLAIYNFYFKGSCNFVTFVGAGAGIFTLFSLNFDSKNINLSLESKDKFGGMIRTGFEWGKFRFGVDYNLIPNSYLKDLTGNEVAKVKNYDVGIYIGGGKWKKINQ